MARKASRPVTRSPGRPSRINDTVDFPDPDTGATIQLPITEAACRYMEMGCWGENATGSLGITTQTFHNWMARGAEHSGQPVSKIPKRERPFVEFFEKATRAERRGLLWHELNVRRVANGGEGDGRLSLEFLARRQPERYSREKVKVEHSGTVALTDERKEKIDNEISGLLAGLQHAGEATNGGPPPG